MKITLMVQEKWDDGGDGEGSGGVRKEMRFKKG